MIKGKELLGRHVVDLSTGERVDSVRDIVFDHGANLVLGLVVDGGGSWLRRRDRVIPFAAVYSVGEDAVMITSAQDAASDEEQARMKEIMDSKVNLIGMTLLTSQGEDLGKIGDVVFDEYSGRVEGYEVTGGLFADVAGGRAFVPAPESVQIGKDVAIVPASVAEEMRRSGGGWPAPTGEERAELGGDYSREELAEQAAQRQRDYLVGRIAGTSIILPDGTVVAEKGEPITDEQVTRAERSGRLMVLSSTSLSPEEVAGAEAAEKTPEEDAAGAEKGSAVEAGPPATVREAEAAPQPAAPATPEPLTEPGEPALLSFSEMVGRRVREDVTDAQGNLLAAQGQMITPAVLTRAEELGMLEDIQLHLREGTESAAEPLDLGEYERRSADTLLPRPATPAATTAAPAVTDTTPPAELEENPSATVPMTAPMPTPAAEPGSPDLLDTAPLDMGRLDTAPLDTAPLHMPEPEPPVQAQTADVDLIPGGEGRLTAVPSPEPQDRPIRARAEQVVHLSEPTPAPEPGLLEKARRWLDDRREDLLHDPSERELVQVYEQWGAPVTAPPEPALPQEQAQVREREAAEHSSALPPRPAPQPTVQRQTHVQAQAAPTPDAADEGETLVLRGPAPQLTDLPQDEQPPAPLLAQPVDLDLTGPAPLAPAADPLQPVGGQADLSETAGELRAELAHPAPAPHHAPQPALPQTELTADPLQPAGEEPPAYAQAVETVANTAAPDTAAALANAEAHEPALAQSADSAEGFNQATIENIVQQAYGWPVERTVRAESGEVVLAEGGRVTPAAVAEAKRLGVLRELLSAVRRGE
ncbi:PRC-barrel domain protein [Deinococcus proteolyticus MRP]|uniref:PRC-barrel domain protein n=1 Tax=Deinococcus proteolyticus (strain ATCC 35074 / DSM 20540 / JCM 6276 / NBRC 101906 / NCIMB 13154 / VKM Ac-1939 / CCM 2703 / MRP) TaxID=693977 RepID=F0RLN6_DEIPM|nr:MULTISPECIES: PRC-barrel domain-containing protein [Deinococcus]ADY25875.1 PRC-barrel domain protein [Deinococcus proteolyticus MRP]MCY1701997.1 PRC-barrel domain-containing protein [Deinococcus sp. SL84]